MKHDLIPRLVKQIVACVATGTYLNGDENNFVYSFLLLKYDLLKTTPTDMNFHSWCLIRY
jgi:hypothetical protein